MSTTDIESTKATTSETATRRRSIYAVLKIVLVALAAVVAVFLGVVAVQPDDYRVVRSATFNAPASEVFDHVNDFQKWEAWSPWAKLDPAAKNTFEGPAAGTGAIFSWDGNDEVGAGRMTITDSKPHELVRMKLEFFRPMEDSCITEFAFQPTGEQTTVTWSMIGKHPNFVGKAFCTLMNMDKMVGTDFEKGLANMKTVVEKAP